MLKFEKLLENIPKEADRIAGSVDPDQITIRCADYDLNCLLWDFDPNKLGK